MNLFLGNGINFEVGGIQFPIVGPKQNRNAFEGALYIAKPVCCNLIYLEGFGEVWDRFANYGVTLGLERAW